MKIIGKIGQAGSALWILNVWFNRFNKDTGYRGGNATNMREEFEEYGLPEPVMYAVGATKVSLATMMLIGLVKPKLARPASAGLATLMVAFEVEGVMRLRGRFPAMPRSLVTSPPSLSEWRWTTRLNSICSRRGSTSE